MTQFLDLWSAHPITISYLVLINTLTLFIYGADKLSAEASAWRVRERTLLFLALIGGSAGALIGMNLFHHKTRKVSFQILFVVILLIQFTLITWAMDIYPLSLTINN